MTISVIIPAYNAQATIGQTLQALAHQDYPHPFEIIVVDDGSKDRTAEVIRSFGNVRYEYQSNTGPAAARNQGARLAKGELIIFTDSDCVPHKDWISKLIQGFNSSQIAVVMGSYGIANESSLLATCVYKEILFRHKHLLPDYPKVFGSYNFCVKRTVFEQVGGFNTIYRQASGEDNDLSYKIIAAGWRIYFERKALVDHYHPVQVSRYLKEQFRHGFWRAKMYLIHPTMIKGDNYTFWKDLLEIPWSVACITAIALSLFSFMSFKTILFFLFLPFLIFELFFASLMLFGLHKQFFWGFIMFLRSFSRTLGLSTGFFVFLAQKFLNKY